MKIANSLLLHTTLLIIGLLTSLLVLAGESTSNAEDAEYVSQMVNLVPDPNTLCPLTNTFQIHQKINDDASLSEFAIPAGYSLVITGVEGAAIVIESDTNSAWILAGGQSVALVKDVVVKRGVKLCSSTSNFNLHGHLEKNH